MFLEIIDFEKCLKIKKNKNKIKYGNDQHNNDEFDTETFFPTRSDSFPISRELLFFRVLNVHQSTNREIYLLYAEISFLVSF